MIPAVDPGAVVAIVSGIFAASAGVTGKLAFEAETVEKLCRRAVDSATFLVEENLQFPVPGFEACSSYQVSSVCLLLVNVSSNANA